MTQEDLQSALEALGKSGITVNGDLVLEKHVENEIGNVEPGGIGIQINNGDKEGTPMTAGDMEIKAAVEALLKEKDDEDRLLFRNKKQWWAVYRVLNVYCNYPNSVTGFVAKINDLGIDYGGNENVIAYNSITKVGVGVGKIATCEPSAWGAFKDLSDNYRQQYEVAEFLMQKLCIYS